MTFKEIPVGKHFTFSSPSSPNGPAPHEYVKVMIMQLVWQKHGLNKVNAIKISNGQGIWFADTDLVSTVPQPGG